MVSYAAADMIRGVKHLKPMIFVASSHSVPVLFELEAFTRAGDQLLEAIVEECSSRHIWVEHSMRDL